MANKKALIVGMYGQDGSYMADLLKSKGYDVYPCTRQDNPHDLIDNIRPNEVYNFASTSNVFDPWSNLDEVFKTDALLPVKIMESILKIDKSIKFFQASSCLKFGGNIDIIQDEYSRINPVYPYGAAKAYADMMVKQFREVHGLFACSGILFNHESPRRGKDFFVKKICHAAANRKKVIIGNIDSVKDIGYAPEFMEAVYLMMQAPYQCDYIIGTGKLTLMSDIIIMAFEYVGLDHNEYVVTDKNQRVDHSFILRANTNRIFKDLYWKAKTSVSEIIKIMIDHEKSL